MSQCSFVETFHELVLHDLEVKLQTDEKGITKCQQETRAGHISQLEKRVLGNLKTNPDIVLRSADKGGGIVLQDYDEYHYKALKILSD